jgi:hypothetical protein
MKNILAENLLRFGVKNLKESDVKILQESLLVEQVQAVSTALTDLNAAMAKYPTKIKNSQVYPVITLTYGTALPAIGKTLTKDMIPRGLSDQVSTTGVPTSPVTDIFSNEGANSSLVGKKMPIKLICTAKKQIAETDPENYKTFIRNVITDGPNIALWGWTYTAATAAPTTTDTKAALKNYCNKFYTTDTNNSFWGVKNIEGLMISGQFTNIETQLDALLNSLSSLQVINTGKKMYCMAPKFQSYM